MVYTVIIYLLIFCACAAIPDDTTYVADGRKIILRSDGTWTELPKEDIDGKSNFRKTTWGMSIQAVKSSESEELLKAEDDALWYKTTIGGNECVILYLFVDNMLCRSKYIFSHDHTNKNLFIQDYSALKADLQKKYGDPDEDEVVWLNSLYKDDLDDWGLAISIGHLAYYTKWVIDNTQIYLSLRGDKYKIQLVIEYQSLALRERERQYRESQKLDDL